jgi:hypothetical protein
MNFQAVFNSLAVADTERYDRCFTRRRVIKSWLPKLGLAVLPLTVGGFLQKAHGKASDAVMESLRLALTMERLESSFYDLALRQAGFIPAGPQRQCLELIAANETAHVSFVELMIQSAGGSTDGLPHQFDYTGGKGSNAGPFVDVFDRYETFLAVAQLLQETAARAYNGAVPGLMGNQEILQGALQIHSVEARHAARLRQLRQENGFADIRPWITQMQSGITQPAAFSVYAGEGNTLQAGIELAAQSGLSADAVTEAFDEPLGMEAVMAIVSNFIRA